MVAKGGGEVNPVEQLWPIKLAALMVIWRVSKYKIYQTETILVKFN